MKKITATVRDLKEILEMEDVVEYRDAYISLEGDIYWDFDMNKYIGKEIEITGINRKGNYIYGRWYFKPEWLKDIKEEEVDWENVPVDTKVLVRDFEDQKWKKRYFKSYNPENDSRFEVFSCGRDSWTEDTSFLYKYCKLYKD